MRKNFKKVMSVILTLAMVLCGNTAVIQTRAEGDVAKTYTNDFESENALDDFVDSTGAYGNEYATDQLSELVYEDEEHGTVWKFGQGGGWNAFNKRYLADYRDMALSFEMRCDTPGEKAMIYVRGGEDGDSGYEVDIYNDRVAVTKGSELKSTPLETERGEGWNSYRVTCIGRDITVYMNDKKVFEFNDADTTMRGGFGFAGWRCTTWYDNLTAEFYNDVQEEEKPEGDDVIGDATTYMNGFGRENALDDFVNSTGGYGDEYAKDQISEVEYEGGRHGYVWKLGQGGGWNAFNKRYLADYSDMALSFDLRCDNPGEKAMIYVRGGEDGGSGYEIGIYDDRITIMMGEELKSTPLETKRGEGWNSYTIICSGKTISVYMNSVPVFTYDEADPDMRGGFAFAGWRCTVRIDNIRADFFNGSSKITNDFESPDALDDFVNATGAYGNEYATQQLSELVHEDEKHGTVWKFGQGGGWNAFNKRYLANYSDMALSFEMRCDTPGEKAMIYVRAEEDGDSGYEVDIYNDRVAVVRGSELKSTPLKEARGEGWNSYQIMCIKNDIIVYMNGTKVFEYNDADPEVTGGFGFAGWRCTTWYDNLDVHFFSRQAIPKAFTLNRSEINMSVGDISALSTVYENIRNKQHNDKWTSSDEGVAAVSSTGIITAKSSGTAIITAENYDGVTASCTVNVNSPCTAFYYVSADGSDTDGDGSMEKPFATLERARDFLRTINLPDGGVTVYLRGGEYYTDSAITFTPEDSGEKGKPIVYSSYPGEEAIINSGKRLTGFRHLTDEDNPIGLPDAARDYVFVTDIEKGWRFHDLYVNGTRQQAARQFNTNVWRQWETLDKDIVTPIEQKSENGMLIKFKDGSVLEDLPNNGDVEMNLMPVEWWNSLPIVREIDPAAKTARIESFNPSIGPKVDEGAQLFQHGGPYNLMNAPKFLDEPGEWCVDSENGKVYWWPKNVKDIDNAIAPYATELVRLQGDEEEQGWSRQVEFIEFRNLTFMYSDRLPEDKWSDSKTAPDLLIRNSENVDAAIYMQGVKNITVADSTIKYTGAYAITFDHYAQNNTVLHNELGNLGCGGVQILGYGPGLVDVNHHNTVIANNIHDTGLAPYQHSSAVTIHGSGYNNIKYNNMYNMPYTAVMLTGTDGESMNPEHFDSRAYSDTYGNMNTQYAIRYDDIRSLDPEVTSKFDFTPAAFEPAQQYQHSEYNVIEYNMATDYMMYMSDGGCYYAWCTGANNEYNFNIGQKLTNLSGGGSHTMYIDNCAVHFKVEGNLFWSIFTSIFDNTGAPAMNIWKDNFASAAKPAGYDELQSKINAAVAEIGGYKQSGSEPSYEKAPLIQGISVKASDDPTKTVISLPDLPDGAVKFVLKSVSSDADVFIGDNILADRDLTAGADNEITSVNGKKYIVAAVDNLGGVVAYADITAKTSGKYVFSYKEDFEDLSVMTDITAKANGWDFSADETTTIDFADGANSGTGIRVSNGDKGWWHSQWVSVDFRENAAAKYASGLGIDSELAKQLAYYSCANDVRLEFDFKPATQWLGNHSNVSNSTETYVRLTDTEGNEFAGFELYFSNIASDSETFNLVALDSAGTSTVRYPVYTGNAVSEQWHHISVTTRAADNTYKVLIDGKPVPGVPEWIPGANYGNVSGGAEHSTVKGISKMEFGNYFSGWWQAAQIDNISLANVTSGDFDFENGTGSYSAVNNGETISVNARVSSDTDAEYTVYTAKYAADGTLLAVKSEKQSVKSGETAEYSMETEYGGEADSVSIFIWDGNMKPLTERIDL